MNTPETKRFHLGAVLSITTERLVARGHIGDVYEILNWLTNDNLFTHQLPRASGECKPWLLRWHPELADLAECVASSCDALDQSKPIDEQIERMFHTLIGRGISEWYDLPRIPRDDHERRNPLTEMREMVGNRPVIVVDAARGGQG